jgi:hypothetical protein
MSQFNKFLIIGAPKSGSHMLARMISRPTKIKWGVVPEKIKLDLFINDSWIMAIHEEYNKDLDIFCKKNDICLLGLTRELGHKDSIERDPSINISSDEINKIKNSIPDKIKIFYDDLVFYNQKKELEKIRKITKINNIEIEKWEDRYKPPGPLFWRDFLN